LVEKQFTISEVDPVDLLGINNRKLDIIQSYFPKIKIISRGDILKVKGSKSDLEEFEKRLQLLIHHIQTYKSLPEKAIEDLMMLDENETRQYFKTDESILLYGTGGNIIKPKTPNQKRLVESIKTNDIVFALGPAGTGKTYTAVALAVKAFKDKMIKRIILTRPAVEAGENLGFLPGDLKEKLDPYLQPLYDALHDMLPAGKLNELIYNGFIQIAPLAFMRGRTLDNAFVILDEAQNATESQFKMFLTRMGPSAKFIITGDMSQIDLPKHQKSGLIQSVKILQGIEGIDFIYFDEKDVIRHPLVKKIIKAYEEQS
jgi:phosphate starvation-inducible PhoH-like protein